MSSKIRTKGIGTRLEPFSHPLSRIHRSWFEGLTGKEEGGWERFYRPRLEGFMWKEKERRSSENRTTHKPTTGHPSYKLWVETRLYGPSLLKWKDPGSKVGVIKRMYTPLNSFIHVCDFYFHRSKGRQLVCIRVNKYVFLKDPRDDSLRSLLVKITSLKKDLRWKVISLVLSTVSSD